MKSILLVPTAVVAVFWSFQPSWSQLEAQEAAAGKPAVSGEAISKVVAGDAGSSATDGIHAAEGGAVRTFPGKTILDDPAANDARVASGAVSEGKRKGRVTRLSKIDLDGDLNYDGTINNEDPSNQGQLEYVPPGLEIGVGELTRLVIRHTIHDVEFAGQLAVTIEVAGINRDSASGSFPSGLGGEVGRIKVWRDEARAELLLDSADPEKLSKTWIYEKGKLSGGIPRTVCVEGVNVSAKFEGDLRLMALSSHRPDGSAPASSSALFQSAFDHMLVTVRQTPVSKEFVNNNAEGVWFSPGAAGSAENGETPAAPR